MESTLTASATLRSLNLKTKSAIDVNGLAHANPDELWWELECLVHPKLFVFTSSYYYLDARNVSVIRFGDFNNFAPALITEILLSSRLNLVGSLEIAEITIPLRSYQSELIVSGTGYHSLVESAPNRFDMEVSITKEIQTVIDAVVDCVR